MRDPLAFLKRLAIAFFAVVCMCAGQATVKPGVPTPPAIVELSAEREVARFTDVCPMQLVVARKRAFDPADPPLVVAPHGSVVGDVPAPRGPPAPHGEARGPPSRA